MNIRSASNADAPGIAAVHIASWRAVYRGFISDAVLDGLDLGQRTGMWREILALPKADTFVAEEPPIIGFCNLAPSTDETESQDSGELTSIYLRPDRWRCGIGRQLMQTVVTRAKERRFRRIVLWVLRENRTARSFYEALGFTEDGERLDASLVDRPVHQVRYVLDLDEVA